MDGRQTRGSGSEGVSELGLVMCPLDISRYQVTVLEYLDLNSTEQSLWTCR